MITATPVRHVNVQFAGKVEHSGETTTIHALLRQPSATSTQWILISAHGEPYLSIPTPSALQIGTPAFFTDFDSALAAFVQAPGVYRPDDPGAEHEVLSALASTPIPLYAAPITVFSDDTFDPLPLLTFSAGSNVGVGAGSSSVEAALLWDVEADEDTIVPAANPAVTITASGKALPIPGGHSYWPRTIFGTADVDALRAIRGHMNVRIVGPPGCGKTTLPRAAFGDEVITVQGHGDLTVAGLYGQWLPAPPGADVEFIWVDGPLTVAAKTGAVFLFDEANRAPEEVIGALLSATDDRRAIVINDRPDQPVVHAADGFMLIITYNEDDHGVRPLSRALLRRCPFQIRVDTDFDIAGSAGVDQDLIAVAENCKTAALEHAQAICGPPRWWPQMADLLAATQAMSVLGTASAAGVLLAACPSQDRAWLATIIQTVFGHPVSEIELGPPL